MAQVINADDVAAVEAAPKEEKRKDSAAASSAPRTPPPGLAHSAYRGFVGTMQGLDQTMANVMGVIDKIPGVTPGEFGKNAQADADRRGKELAEDTRVPQTTGEKLTEGTVRAVGGTIPYLATDGPIGAGVVGALEEAHNGPEAALKAGVRSALFQKAGSVVGKGAGKVLDKTPIVKDLPKVVKRAGTGAATAAVLAPGGERGAQAIAGGLAGASQAAPKSANEVRASRLMAATGKTGGDAMKAYRVAGPALEETARLTGKQPGTVEELKQTVADTSKRLRTEYRSYIDPIRNQQVWGTPVADAIRSSIKRAEINGVTKDTEAVGKALEERAKEYEKQFSVEELDNLREILFENLNGNSKENLKERSSAEVRADRIAEGALKDLLYPIVDQQAQRAGKPAGYIRGRLKTDQANLIQINDALIKRTKELSEKEGIHEGTPLTQRGNVTLAAHPGGSLVGSIHGLMNTLFGDPNSAKEANKRVASSFPVKQAKPGNRVAAVTASARSGQKKDEKPAEDAPPSTVTMKAPNGDTQEVPADQVEHYKSKGATVVQ